MKIKQSKDIKERQVESKKLFVKDLAVNLVFSVFLFPLAVMLLLLNPIIDFCLSSRSMAELTRNIVISAVILLAFLAVMITAAVLLARRRRKKRLFPADNSEVPPRRRLIGIHSRVLPRIIVIGFIVLSALGGIFSHTTDSMDTPHKIFFITGIIALYAVMIWGLYVAKGIRTMCGKCRCLFFLEPYGSDERVRTGKAIGIVSEDIYQRRKYVDEQGKEYKVYNTEEHVGLVNREIYRSNCMCKYCGMRYFSLYGKND